MPGLPLEDVLAAVGGRIMGVLDEGTIFPRAEVDPGSVRAGDLYVAAPGDPIDGHELVVVAALRGAAAAVVAESWAARVRELPLPLVVVDDAPVAALHRLAAFRRGTLALTVVGITGSVGKTSAKEAVAAVLGQRFRTYRNPGNRNNEIGLPLSLLEVEAGTEVAVLEMGGAFAPGEIELLARIARPQIAVVTNVYPVHLERMGSIDAIAETKEELVRAVPSDGIAVVNGDDARTRAMAAACAGRVVTYGLSRENDVRADAVRTHGLDGCSFRLELPGEQLEVRLPLLGGHAVQLALAAVAVGHELGMGPEEMLPGLRDPAIQARLRPLPGPAGSILLDDTYNASTPSVLSALQLLEEAGGARRIAVLGDMLELGELSQREHRVVGRRAARSADLLVTYGPLARLIADEAASASARFARGRLPVQSFDLEQRAELIEFLQAELRDGDVALVKGSRALRMELIVTALSSHPQVR